MNMKTFCIRPFIHSLVSTSGEYKPCCRYSGKTGYNLSTHSVEQWWNSDYLKDLRNQMISGNHIKECRRCYRQEEQGVKSFRQNSNEEWAQYNATPSNMPVDWEIQITNLCNLKCLMCNPWSSSQVLQEDNKIFGLSFNQHDYEWNPDHIEKIKEMFHTGQSFVIRGGEPFIVPWLQDIVNEIPGRKRFLINTNATKFDQKWFDILSRHDVRMSLSIDGYQDLNYYIRFPSNWTDILSNINKMKLLPSANVFINTCVQNLNVLELDKLLIWAHNQNLFVNLDVLTYPVYFEPSCLPQALLDLATERLISLPSYVKKNTQGFNGVLETLKKSNLSNWSTFQEIILAKDNYRNHNIINYIPELKDYLC